jgi:hypothetical protein
MKTWDSSIWRDKNMTRKDRFDVDQSEAQRCFVENLARIRIKLSKQYNLVNTCEVTMKGPK